MNRQQTNRSHQRRRSQGKRPAPVDIWRTPGPLPAIEPIPVAHDVGALLRSLGDPPMNRGIAAGHYFGTVAERAAALAVALAFSVDLVAPTDGD